MKTIEAYEVNGTIYASKKQAARAERAHSWGSKNLKTPLGVNEIEAVKRVIHLLRRHGNKTFTVAYDHKSIRHFTSYIERARVKAALCVAPHCIAVRTDAQNRTFTFSRI